MEIRFTKHAMEQMLERGISEDDAMSTIKYPDAIQKEYYRYLAKKRFLQYTLVAVYTIEKYIKVLTVYPA